ncbi:MAG: alpha-1,4-glucan--maltose-1-phosphate maltosyltransferase [Acidobacteria bacterium]|nr:alpha-1,4-glucan--maltose-1-phosphate maltosyltransferase [Acidobacteriota bacterium]
MIRPESQPRSRVAIADVRPEIEAGRFPIKRCAGEQVIVTADIHSDGYDVLSAMLRYRSMKETDWQESAMQHLGNDLWQGSFRVERIGEYRYTLQAWVDRFKSWLRDFEKKIEAGQDVWIDLTIGSKMIAEAAQRASGEDAARLGEFAHALGAADRGDPSERTGRAVSQELRELMDRYSDRSLAANYEKELVVVVEREKARFSAWYEIFPRSCAPKAGKHGTFRDCETCLPYIASLGFDVLYLAPIHPIGRTHRKGRNGSEICAPNDVGSPWAIGSEEGGHTAIHPQLGSLEDFRHLVTQAAQHGIEIALDLAFQCSPDHPWVREQPEWFRQRPDGTIQYAENPPKKYEDIYPLNFETVHWRELWEELLGVVLFWKEQGVRIFRVDNPHTKPYAFWEWLIAEVRTRDPQVIFLSEAFTRPKVMYRLAKLGFSQSYTYFTWRNTKPELQDYFTDLTRSEVREFLRPNLWPNTPDILPEYLQLGGLPAFMIRLVLAATLGASYGIYGPAYELCENAPRSPGSEEYLDSEKYEIRHRSLDSAASLKDYIARINTIRRNNPALHQNWNLRFHEVANPTFLCYSKATEDFSNVILVVVNLDFRHTQSGWVDLDLSALGLDGAQPYQAHDLLTDTRYFWQGGRNYVELDPQEQPAHVLRLRRKLRTERDFDYYL